MPRSYEREIRWKAIGIYMFIAVICLAVSVYIYSLSRNVRGQKEHIETYYDLLRVTNRVSFAVSDAQSTANLYLTSKSGSHLVSFRHKVAETALLIDSLTYLSRLTGDTSNLESLQQISGLLNRKGDIIYRLNTQLVSYNPVDSIASRLFIPDAVQEPAVNDSVFLLGNRRELWDVMSNVFLPQSYRDSMVTAYRNRPPVVEETEEDSIKIDAGVRQYVEQVRTRYSSNLREVQRQINTLMRTDQEISEQIIDVLNRFHRTTMQSTIRHIETSEENIRKNYRYSLGGIVISLLLITLLVILIISDANKGQSARMALERANARIREIMASRHKLLLSVSHDIKTPLSAILGYLELWKNGNVDESQIDSAELSGKHIGALINNLLEFSSLQQGISKPSPHPFDLRNFCEETAGMIRPQTIKKGLDFITAFNIEHGITVEADSMRVRQIVLNILSNAIKYTPQGTVKFRASYSSGHIVFRVSDTGSGMNSEELERVFKPFSRLDGNRAMAEGHGYGMYVVKGLIELLGGEITVKSEPGKGTSVKITVPAPLAVSKDGSPLTGAGSKRILFIDDDPLLLQVLSSLASGLGHTVQVSSAPAGLISGSLDISLYDMVITDMEMGTVTGEDILRKVKKERPGLPVVIMTGHHDITAETACRMGFDGYLAKPVSQQALAAITGNGSTGPDTKPAPAAISEMFDDDETLREIMDTFVTATLSDTQSLRSALFRRDHRRVREICHRLFPLMHQFGAHDCLDVLSRINGHSPQTRDKTEYWQDVSLFITLCTDYVKGLKVN